MSFHSTFLPSTEHTRWKLMRPLSFLCSMLKCSSFSRTAVNSRTGIVTSPKLIDPFQIACAIVSPETKAPELCSGHYVYIIPIGTACGPHHALQEEIEQKNAKQTFDSGVMPFGGSLWIARNSW